MGFIRDCVAVRRSRCVSIILESNACTNALFAGIIVDYLMKPFGELCTRIEQRAPKTRAYGTIHQLMIVNFFEQHAQSLRLPMPGAIVCCVDSLRLPSFSWAYEIMCGSPRLTWDFVL